MSYAGNTELQLRCRYGDDEESNNCFARGSIVVVSMCLHHYHRALILPLRKKERVRCPVDNSRIESQDDAERLQGREAMGRTEQQRT